MATVFNSVKGLHPKRNAFSAHTYRNDFTSQLGVNLPVYIQHVTPASRVKVSTSALVRLQALIAPVMDNIDFYVHFWKIPYRLIENDQFTQFISQEIDASEYNACFASPKNFADDIITFVNNISSLDTYEKKLNAFNTILGNGSLLDMLGYDAKLFGIPKKSGVANLAADTNNPASTKTMNWRGLIAYYMLHINWYMNENVPYFSTFVDDYKSFIEDPDYAYLTSILTNTYKFFGTSFLPHGWEKDYFTSALPNVQFGDPVTLPISGSAPVIPNADNPMPLSLIDTGQTGSTAFPEFISQLEIAASGSYNANLFNTTSLASNHLTLGSSSNPIESINGRLIPLDGATGNAPFIADLSEASAITINELRFANALQVFKERQERFGRRRLEHYKGFFDVSPEDLRLQVPKYLGGGRIPINIADIEQTSATSGSQALGRLAGKATAVAGGFAGFQTFCSEESIIIGIAFAMPHITYCQAVSKFILKTNDIYDYFNPSFEHLGEQAITNIEIYSGASSPDTEFGYTPRYNEYRFHLNEMHGEFKNTLSYWTLGRIFSSQPSLNADFIYMQPSVFDRIFAVSGQPSMLVSMLFRQRIIQPVSKYGTPMLLS